MLLLCLRSLEASLQRALPFEPIRSAARLLAGTQDQMERYEAELDHIRQRQPLPEFSGTVDGYPAEAHAILAHHRAYDPRPVIESYAAYTPELAELNAAHLRGDHAPDTILFDVRPFDGRFPSLTDGLSWPELLTRYDVKDTAGRLLFLQKATSPRAFTLAPIAQTEIALAEIVAIPPLSEGPIWARIDVHATWFGALWSALYKPSPLLFNVQTSSGEVFETYLVPALARAGFLLSPVIADRTAFARLASSRWQNDLINAEVRAIQIVPTDGRIPEYVRTGVTLSLYRLEFPRSE